MKSVRIFLLAISVFIFAFSSLVYAEVPQMINYQGKITKSSGALIDTTVAMVFSIYSDSIGVTPLWTETQTVKVEYGVYSVLLGSVIPIPSSVFNGSVRYLGLKVGSDLEMTPRKAMVSVVYAYHSGTADTAHFAMPDADWTINGDTIYHLVGNVCIGTDEPFAKLTLDYKAENQPYGIFSKVSGNDACGVMGAAIASFTTGGNAVGVMGTGAPSPSYGGDNIYGGYFNTIYVPTGIVNNLYGIYALGNGKSSEGTYGVYAKAMNSQVVNYGIYAEVPPEDSGFVGYFQGEKSYFSGKVGIGTTSPTERLDVDGTVRMTGFKMPTGASSGYVLASDASGVGTWQAAPNGGIGGSGTTNYIPKFTAATTIENSAIYESGGNIGIGTTTPSSKLTVNGNIGLYDNAIYLRYGGSDTNHGLAYDSVADGARLFGWQGITLGTTFGGYTERMRITSNGNVGIGTTTPAYKLDVNGDIRASGNIYGNFSGTIDNADKVDGIHASTTPTANYLYPLDASTKIPNARLYTGSGNGFDADKLDGIHGSQFLRNDQSDTLYGNLDVMNWLWVHGNTQVQMSLDVRADAFVGHDVWISGNLHVSGTKTFVQPHPKDTTKTINYVCLEGGEAGTYIRGSGQLQGGVSIIPLPEHFGLVTSENGLTAQVTPRDGTANGYLYVESVTPAQLVVRESGGGSSNAKYDYLVQGVRKGYENYQVIQERKMPRNLDQNQSLLKK